MPTKKIKKNKAGKRTKTDINVRFFTPDHYRKVQIAASKTFEDGRAISMNRFIVRAVMEATERVLSANGATSAPDKPIESGAQAP